MGEEDDIKELFESPGFVDHHHHQNDRKGDHQWTNMENDDDETLTCKSSSPSMEDSSTICSSISDMLDDASSSSSSTSTNSNGPLYELSELMAQLPIKRGLSKYFQGKSQSFTRVSSVRNIQQFAKKERHHKRKIKAYGGGFKHTTLASCRPPLFPVQTKNFSSL